MLIKWPCFAVWMRSHCVLIRTQLFSCCLNKRKLSSWKETICSHQESACLGQIVIIPPLSFCLMHFVSFLKSSSHCWCCSTPLYFTTYVLSCSNLHSPTVTFDHLTEKFYPAESTSCLSLEPLIPSAVDSHPPSCWNSAQLTQTGSDIGASATTAGVECYFWSSISNGIL